MGISGLLNALRDIMDPVSVESLRGKTAAIDAFSWLHKGVYACSTELCLGQTTNKHVKYVLDKLDMLQALGVKPYMVFDGDYLPMKAGKEDERAASRKKNLEKGLKYLKDGNSKAAHNCFVKAVDVTPEMSFEIIKVLRERNIQYVVAPYEADAQLAWLCKNGHADFVISEDSDCIPFGCDKVLFKMDRAGNGLLYHSKHLCSCEKLDFLNWTHDMLLDMCILAGCDYLPSIKGMGVIKAHALISKHRTPKRIFQALRFTGAMRVPPGYEARFREARLTFLHQRVFDPAAKAMCTLTPLDTAATSLASSRAGDRRMSFLGRVVDNKTATEVANGIVHPTTKVPFALGDSDSALRLSDEDAEKIRAVKEALEAAKKPKGPATAAQMKAFFATRSTKRANRKLQSAARVNSTRPGCKSSCASASSGAKRVQSPVLVGSSSTRRLPGAVIGGRSLASYSLVNSQRVGSRGFQAPRSTSASPATSTEATNISAMSSTTAVTMTSSSTKATTAICFTAETRSMRRSTSQVQVAGQPPRPKRKACKNSKYFPSQSTAKSKGQGHHNQHSLRRALSNEENVLDCLNSVAGNGDDFPTDSPDSVLCVTENFRVLHPPGVAALRDRVKTLTQISRGSSSGAFGSILDKFAFGRDDVVEEQAETVRIPRPEVAAPPKAKRPRGVKGPKVACDSQTQSGISWNEFQRMHRGKQVTTTEWRAYQRSQHLHGGGRADARGSDRGRHSPVVQHSTVLVQESPDIANARASGAAARSRARSKNAADVCAGSGTDLFSQFFCNFTPSA
eukprot:INCI8962.1.p1 GENE.INCI8962.1~~INCI8962.1.p1  ORF type:complete len:792 (+),score=121.07 INCI8962.1:162-2537(+)